MSNMIDRVAIAIANATHIDEPNFNAIARAAIEEMREPTVEMLYAASRVNHPRDVEIWQAMIDGALE